MPCLPRALDGATRLAGQAEASAGRARTPNLTRAPPKFGGWWPHGLRPRVTPVIDASGGRRQARAVPAARSVERGLTEPAIARGAGQGRSRLSKPRAGGLLHGSSWTPASIVMRLGEALLVAGAIVPTLEARRAPVRQRCGRSIGCVEVAKVSSLKSESCREKACCRLYCIPHRPVRGLDLFDPSRRVPLHWLN